jgi:hypothetical protein
MGPTAIRCWASARATAAGTPSNGNRFVGAVFTVKALSGSPRDQDANSNALLVGSNGQT